MIRSVGRLGALFALPLLASCAGGGASAPTAAPMTASQAAPAAQAATRSVPQSAARGVLVTVKLPLRNGDDLDSLLRAQTDQSSPEYRHFITPEQFRAAYAPAAADLAAVETDLQARGLRTYRTSQSVLADGDVATVERAFNVHLRAAQGRRGLSNAGRTASAATSLASDIAPKLPAALVGRGAMVAFQAITKHVHSRVAALQPLGTDNRYSTTGPYWFTDLKQAYGYPSYTTANGSGRTIGIVISSDYSDADVLNYFGHEKLVPPTVERRPVNGGAGFDPNSGASAEASLDVQQSLGSAPGAHGIVYTIPDLSDNNILAAYQAVVDDNRADIVSSSFGGCELYYTAAYNGGTDYTSILTQQFHDIFRQGNAQGITWVASSGDNGAYGCLDPTGSTFVKGVENPANDPDVVAVGGTNLVTATVPGSRDSSYVRENADYDQFDPAQGALPNEIWGSGGGISTIFKKPWYQYLANTGAATRTIPDVSMHMGGCPYGSVQPCAPDRSSDVTSIGGQFYLLIGTSASAPEFAGLLAVTESHLGGIRLGNANGYIYGLGLLGGNVYRQNIPGNNGYAAHPGYNLVLGEGTPKAANFAAAPGLPTAGVPQTPSNP